MDQLRILLCVCSAAATQFLIQAALSCEVGVTLEEVIVQNRDLQQCGRSWAMTDGSLLRIPVMGEIYGWQNLDNVSMK